MSSSKLASDVQDQVTLVDPGDVVIGQMDKVLAHQHPAQLHRAISVWLTCDGKVLLQQRSREKIVGKLLWGNTVCGNVRPAESYEDCAVRRLREELGISLEMSELQELYTFVYQAYSDETYGEHEMDRVFAAEYRGSVQPNPVEVADYAWVSLSELRAAVQQVVASNPKLSDVDILLENTGNVLSKGQLRQATHFVELEVQGRSFAIAPWTWVMLLDPRLKL